MRPNFLASQLERSCVSTCSSFDACPLTSSLILHVSLALALMAPFQSTAKFSSKVNLTTRLITALVSLASSSPVHPPHLPCLTHANVFVPEDGNRWPGHVCAVNQLAHTSSPVVQNREAHLERAHSHPGALSALAPPRTCRAPHWR